MPTYPHRERVNAVLVGTDDPNEPFERIRLALHGLLDFTNQTRLAVAGEHQRRDQPVSVSWAPAPDMPTATLGDVDVEIVTQHRFRGEDYEFCLKVNL